MRRIALLTFAAAAAAACTPKSEPAAGSAAIAKVDTAAAKPGIDSLRASYSRLQMAGDATGVAALYTEDATLDVYGAPRSHGRAAIEAGLKADYGMRKFTLSEATPIATDVRTNTDGSEIGTYHDMFDAGGKKNHEWGRYVVGFTKGTDGKWRLTYLMAFPDSTKTDK